jgi:hypothetical protein
MVWVSVKTGLPLSPRFPPQFIPYFRRRGWIRRARRWYEVKGTLAVWAYDEDLGVPVQKEFYLTATVAPPVERARAHLEGRLKEMALEWLRAQAEAGRRLTRIHVGEPDVDVIEQIGEPAPIQEKEALARAFRRVRKGRVRFEAARRVRKYRPGRVDVLDLRLKGRRRR